MPRNSIRDHRNEFGELLISQKEAIQLMKDSAPPELMTLDQFANHMEREAELYAEEAWLRRVESLSWEENYLESLIESGLRSPQ